MRFAESGGAIDSICGLVVGPEKPGCVQSAPPHLLLCGEEQGDSDSAAARSCCDSEGAESFSIVLRKPQNTLRRVKSQEKLFTGTPSRNNLQHGLAHIALPVAGKLLPEKRCQRQHIGRQDGPELYSLRP